MNCVFTNHIIDFDSARSTCKLCRQSICGLLPDNETGCCYLCNHYILEACLATPLISEFEVEIGRLYVKECYIKLKKMDGTHDLCNI